MINSESIPTKRIRATVKAFDYLLDRNILSIHEVVDAGVRLLSCSGERAVTIRAITGSQGGVLFKMAQKGSIQWVRNEILCYRAIDSLTTNFPLSPKLVDSMDHQGILVIELLDPCQTLYNFYTEHPLDSEKAVTELARVIGTLHLRSGASQVGVPKHQPWIFSTKSENAEESSDVESDMWALIGGCVDVDILFDVIRLAREYWQPKCLIHGDVKFDNCLLFSGNDQRASLVLIDWELGAFGDPAWDVATALQEYLLETPVDFQERDGYRELFSSDSRKAVILLLQSYFKFSALEKNLLDPFIERTAMYTACRLIQTTSELSMLEQGLGARSRLAARLAAFIGEDPSNFADFLRKMSAETE